jgi:FKBP-type peptidyl-prolyl cis-trans isomerase (trigger factor)
VVESIVGNIVALEREADALIEEAHLEARRIKLAVEGDLARFKDELARERNERLADLKEQFDRKYQEALRVEESRLADGLKAIDQIPDALVRQQIDRILDRFREW